MITLTKTLTNDDNAVSKMRYSYKMTNKPSVRIGPYISKHYIISS